MVCKVSMMIILLISGLHISWGRGGCWPGANREELVGMVYGGGPARRVPLRGFGPLFGQQLGPACGIYLDSKIAEPGISHSGSGGTGENACAPSIQGTQTRLSVDRSTSILISILVDGPRPMKMSRQDWVDAGLGLLRKEGQQALTMSG